MRFMVKQSPIKQANNIKAFFHAHDRNDLVEHCALVAEMAEKLALRFDLDQGKAMVCGWAHDLGRVISEEAMLDYCKDSFINVLPVEQLFPGLLHQKISRKMAHEMFNIADEEILDAIGLHTTLKYNAEEMSLLLLLADKLSWEDDDKKDFIVQVNQGLEISLQYGAYAYLRHVFKHKEVLQVIHPWMLAAYYDLRDRCEG